jgi:hypothetical protein
MSKYEVLSIETLELHQKNQLSKLKKREEGIEKLRLVCVESYVGMKIRPGQIDFKPEADGQDLVYFSQYRADNPDVKRGELWALATL